uniref:Uncharacterized protein n=1 Tax=Romanomermis culicivorax TaxID=13658 RepID=A0A915KF35_ROMCU
MAWSCSTRCRKATHTRLSQRVMIFSKKILKVQSRAAAWCVDGDDCRSCSDHYRLRKTPNASANVAEGWTGGGAPGCGSANGSDCANGYHESTSKKRGYDMNDASYA